MVFTRQFQVQHSPDNTTFTQVILSPPGQVADDGSYDSRWAAISAVVFCLVCAVINIACLVVYHRVKSRQVSVMTGETAFGQNAEKRKMEFRLTVYAFVTFVAHVLMAVCMINIYVSVLVDNDFLFFATYNQTPLGSVSCLRGLSGLSGPTIHHGLGKLGMDFTLLTPVTCEVHSFIPPVI